MKNSCEGIGEETAMLAFIGGLPRGSLLRHTLTREHDTSRLTLSNMIATASSFAAADNDARGSLQATALPKKNNNGGNNGKCKNLPDDNTGGSDMVL